MEILTQEFWRAVLSLPGYEVSTYGRIRWSGEAVEPYQDASGAVVFNAKLAGKYTTRRVARVVAEAFCRQFRHEFVVQHIDGNKLNCAAANLKCVVRKKKAAIKKSRAGKKSSSPPSPKTLSEAQAAKILAHIMKRRHHG